MTYLNSVLFHQSLSRTKGTVRPHQDWAVAFGYDGAKSVYGWLVTDAALPATIDARAEAMRRRCRRLVERYGIKELIGGEKPGADLYWAAVAVLHDDGKVVAGAMRRDSSKEKRIRNDWGKDTETRPVLEAQAQARVLVRRRNGGSEGSVALSSCS